MDKSGDGFSHHSDEHPAKAELRRLLLRVARLFGLTMQAVDDLARKARIASWNEGQPLSLSGDGDGFVNFLMTGVVRVEIVRAEVRAGILKFVGPGEFFYLAPTPRHRRYHLRAMVHPKPEADGRAMVAMWDRQAITDLLVGLPATGLTQLLETTWLDLSRLAEDRHVMLSLRLQERIVYVLERLVTRFGVPRQESVLIDLFLPDEVIARLVEATRARVNRRMNALRRAGVLRREGPGVVLLTDGSRREAA